MTLMPRSNQQRMPVIRSIAFVFVMVSPAITHAQLFGPQQIISTEAGAAQSAASTDLDGDGDLDVLSASSADDKIAWYSNDGSGGFGPQQIISTLADNARCVASADLDGDGDQDVLSASRDDDKIAWYTNDGSGGFGPEQIISTSCMTQNADTEVQSCVTYRLIGLT